MAARSIALTTVKGGITRLRIKGAALNDSLYDLLNGYVTTARTVVNRPGTVRHAILPTTTFGENITVGLTSFEGSLHVFASESVDVPDGITLHVLPHPDGVDTSGDPRLSEIHFAAPFLGFLYVAAEFNNGDIFHYWLQTGTVWEADTVYKLGDVVTPSIPNGFAYQATRLSAPFPEWRAGVERILGDTVEPTTYNDFFYVVVATLGSNPVSGSVEPIWPTEDGAQVFDDSEGSSAGVPTPTAQPDVTAQPDAATILRYGGGGRLDPFRAVLK